MPLCTQDDVEKLLQIDFGNTPDDSVTQYIAQATAAVVGYVGQELEEAAGLVATLEADVPVTYLFLPRFPVTAVASVVEDGLTLTTPDEYKFYESGALRRVAGQFDFRWSTYVDAVVVTYTAGYSTIPDDVVLATATLAAALFRQGAAFAAHGTSGPVKTITLQGSDSVSYDTSTAVMGAAGSVDEAAVKQLLAPYRVRPL